MYSLTRLKILLTLQRSLFNRARNIVGRLLHYTSSPREIAVDWEDADNWGDKLSPFLIERLTGRSVYKPLFRATLRYSVIGSILERASKQSIVWGAGFISAESKPRMQPLKIHAVRGPLTRNLYISNGIDCPKVFGDPAILMRHLVPGAARKTHKYGLIPHYVDKDDQWVREQKRIFGESAVIINIEGGILDVIEQISSCQFIFSSTLHGLICADTYGVPNARLVLSNNIIGGDFKFKDYRLGVGAAPHQPVRPHATQPRLDELVQLCTIADVSYATQSLMGSYPFNDKAENFPSSST